MLVNDNAGCLTPHGVLSHAFAGTLAPLRVGAGQPVWEDLSVATESQDRVGGGFTSAVLSHHRTYGSVYGGSGYATKPVDRIQYRDQPKLIP